MKQTGKCFRKITVFILSAVLLMTACPENAFASGARHAAETEKPAEKSYVDILMEAAEVSGMSPYVLTAFLFQEQGMDGTSPMISGTQKDYPGIYNYFNVGAYNTDTMTNIQRGLWWAKGQDNGSTSYGRPWNTPEKSITGGASFLGQNYLEKGQNTIYFKRFNVSSKSATTRYMHQYMTNVDGARAEGWMTGQGYENITDDSGYCYLREAHTFYIPVFENMPETPVPEPEGDLNPNYKLKSLSVSGYPLVPDFSISRYEYRITVGGDVDCVNVIAAAIAGTTVVSGTGKHLLEGDRTEIEITSRAQNGTEKIYRITVDKESVLPEKLRGKAESGKPAEATPSEYPKNREENTEEVCEVTEEEDPGEEEETGADEKEAGTAGTGESGGKTEDSGEIETGISCREYDDTENFGYSRSDVYERDPFERLLDAAVLAAATEGRLKAVYGLSLSGQTEVSEETDPGDTVGAKDAELYTDFPESYRPFLIALHKKYPKWRFVPENTGLDWNEAVDNEAKSSLSLVQEPAPASWKSTREEDFDFVNNCWKVYDGSSWVAASREIVAYNMDPRNMLRISDNAESRTVFQFADMSYDREVHIRKGIEIMVRGSFLEKPVIRAGGGSSDDGGGGSSGGGGGGSSGGGAVPAGGKKKDTENGTFSKYWYSENGVWKIRNSRGETITSAWLCDDAVSSNGRNVWYLLNTDGTMLDKGLVQDNTGHYYSLEMNHNGYYGMLRYKSGTYDGIYIEFSQKHDGSFGAILNVSAIEALRAKYGVTKFGIGNESCVYTGRF